jgi:hypothetical protein
MLNLSAEVPKGEEFAWEIYHLVDLVRDQKD